LDQPFSTGPQEVLPEISGFTFSEAPSPLPEDFRGVFSFHPPPKVRSEEVPLNP